MEKYMVKLNGRLMNQAFDSEEDAMEFLFEYSISCGVKFDYQIVKVDDSKQNEFKVGESYYARSVYDHNCVYRVKILKRSEKSVWIKGDLWEKRCAVKKDDEGNEYFMPEHYSCAPVFRSYRLADGINDLADWEM